MNKEEILKELIERQNQCMDMRSSIKDKEVKAQYYGELVGLEYAIGLLIMEEDK